MRDDMPSWLSTLVVIVMLAIWAGLSWILMVLWNWLATDLFGASDISYWQSVGVVALLRVISMVIKGKGKN